MPTAPLTDPVTLTTPASLAGTRVQVEPSFTPCAAIVRIANHGPAAIPNLSLRFCAGQGEFRPMRSFSGTLVPGESTYFGLHGYQGAPDELHRLFVPGQTWCEVRSGADVILCLDMPPADADAESTLAAAAVA